MFAVRRMTALCISEILSAPFYRFCITQTFASVFEIPTELR
jgi:hypothetical protein